jgi:hypothetical protein
MYTLIRLRPAGSSRFCWTGHIYDVSTTGMRFEIDSPIEPGTKVDARAMLPGAHHITFDVTGRVIRLHDEPTDRGPMRMGMIFTSFPHTTDRQKLAEYVVRALAA